MIFRHFLLDVNEANAYVVACEKTRQALLVDAGDFDAAVADFLRAHGLHLSYVFITHDHYDHTGGLAKLVDRFNPEVFAGHGGFHPGRMCTVSQGDQIQVGELEGTVLATPGHTPDGVSLTFPGVVFTGDALFSGSVGGTHTGAQARVQLGHIRENIFSLPDDYEIYPGHGPASTVAIEKNHNPFFN